MKQKRRIRIPDDSTCISLQLQMKCSCCKSFEERHIHTKRQICRNNKEGCKKPWARKFKEKFTDIPNVRKNAYVQAWRDIQKNDLHILDQSFLHYVKKEEKEKYSQPPSPSTQLFLLLKNLNNQKLNQTRERLLHQQ